MCKSFELNIVTLEDKIFSGNIKKIFLRGVEGELEILPNHSPLLTLVSPGPIWFKTDNKIEKCIMILGGVLEVQKNITTILADSVMESKQMDEKYILNVKKNAVELISKRNKKLNYEKVKTELSIASAQLRFIKKIKKLKN